MAQPVGWDFHPSRTSLARKTKAVTPAGDLERVLWRTGTHPSGLGYLGEGLDKSHRPTLHPSCPHFSQPGEVAAWLRRSEKGPVGGWREDPRSPSQDAASAMLPLAVSIATLLQRPPPHPPQSCLLCS